MWNSEIDIKAFIDFNIEIVNPTTSLNQDHS